MPVYSVDLKEIKCPVCGRLLFRRDCDSTDSCFDYSDYYCIECEINITVYTYKKEE